MATRVWVSPALCGCELSIAAVWASDPQPDGKMYQHPASAPGVDNAGKSRNTIQKIEVVSQCAAHAGWEQAITWNPFAVMGGYCDVPAVPDAGQCLYINHWRFTALSLGLTLCRCTPAQCYDAASDAIGFVEHPHHTRRCKVHADDADHGKAMKVQRAYSDLKAAYDALPSVKAEQTVTPFLCTLGEDGKLDVDIAHLDDAEQTAFAKAMDALPDADVVK